MNERSRQWREQARRRARAFETTPGLEGVVLFGSVAADNAGAHSDIDVALIGDPDRLASLTPPPGRIDTVVLSPAALEREAREGSSCALAIVARGEVLADQTWTVDRLREMVSGKPCRPKQVRHRIEYANAELMPTRSGATASTSCGAPPAPQPPTRPSS